MPLSFGYNRREDYLLQKYVPKSKHCTDDHIYLKVNVSHTEVDDNGCKREKYAVHLERRASSRPSSFTP